MKLNQLEQIIYEQMVAEYPAMEKPDVKYSYQDRAFDNVYQVVYFIANHMWDEFDRTLDDIEDKGGQHGDS